VSLTVHLADLDQSGILDRSLLQFPTFVE